MLTVKKDLMSPFKLNFNCCSVELSKLYADVRFISATHSYYLHDKRFNEPLKAKFSVTEILTRWCGTTFYAATIAKNLSNFISFPLNEKHIKYYYVTEIDNTSENSQEQLIQNLLSFWTQLGQVASFLGTKMHNFIETFYIEKKFIAKLQIIDEQILFFKFVYEYQLKPWAVEFAVFDVEFLIAGSIDALFLSPSDNFRGTELIMVDWKRAKNIFKIDSYKYLNSQRTGISKFYKYELQLNLYKHFFERYVNYSKKIVAMYLWVVDPNDSLKPLITRSYLLQKVKLISNISNIYSI